jgi:hypothetical protein
MSVSVVHLICLSFVVLISSFSVDVVFGTQPAFAGAELQRVFKTKRTIFSWFSGKQESAKLQ